MYAILRILAILATLSATQMKVALCQGLGASKADVVASNGREFESGVSNEGLKYITYRKPDKAMFRISYFFNGMSECVLIASAWQPSLANVLITRFNEKYVKLHDGKKVVYKDYQTNTIQEVEAFEEFILITMRKDAN